MEEFVDIHCHLLPKIDDGAENLNETLEMLDMAYMCGITTIIATPHFHEGRYKNKVADLEATLSVVKDLVRDLYPDLKIHLGSEIYFSQECLKQVQNGEIPTLAGSKYILVEFSPFLDYKYIIKSLQECLFLGYLPILAHIERYKCLEEDINRVEELIDLGIYTQVNAMSVIGGADGKIRKFTKKLLKNDLVHFVATDAHNMKSRTPLIGECAYYLNKKFGKDYLYRVLKENPRKILLNEYI